MKMREFTICAFVSALQSVPVDNRSVGSSDRIHTERIPRQEDNENEFSGRFVQEESGIGVTIWKSLTGAGE